MAAVRRAAGPRRRRLCAAAWAAAVRPAAGVNEVSAEAYSFGRFVESMLRHPDPEVSEVAKMVEYNAWPHKECTDVWNTQIDWNDVTVIWTPNPTAFKEAERCAARGSRAFYVWASGNSSEYFPEPFVMCLIPQCSSGFLREYYVLYCMLGIMMRQPDARPSIRKLREALRVSRVRVDEVVTFPAEGLPSPDFVVAGFPLSGSSSLVVELSQHPQIAMPHVEDQVFWNSLLTRRAMREWARPYLQLAERKRGELPANGSGRVLLGLKEPMIVFNSATMQQLSGLPELKVIVLVRDPMAMIQSWINHGCDWLTPHGEELSYWVGLQHRHLQILFRSVPRERVLLVPTLALTLAPSLAHERILAFLGLPPSAPSSSSGRRPFRERVNVWDSSNCRFLNRCLDLCRVPGMRALLTALFRADRRKLDRLLAEAGWPRELRGLASPCPGEQSLSLQAEVEEPATEAQPSLCSSSSVPFAPDKCFGSLSECLSCCDRQEDDCAPQTPRWRRCCLWRQSFLLTALRDGSRKVLCGRDRPPSMPCCTGRGRFRFLNVP